jgi:hypothetical protein
MWRATWSVRELSRHGDPDLALNGSRRSVKNTRTGLPDTAEARSVGRSLIRWKHQLAVWHWACVRNGPSEGVKKLIKPENDRLRVHVIPELTGSGHCLYAARTAGALLLPITPR